MASVDRDDMNSNLYKMVPSHNLQGIQPQRSIVWGMLLLLLVGPLSAWAADPLLMGVFPRRNTEVSHKMFNPMAEYLSEQLGREVQLVLRKDFASFWKGVMTQQYDIVHYNQYHYLKSHKEQGYQVILHNQEFGRDTLAGAIVVRKDSGINEIQDLKGKSIIFGGGPQAFIAYIAVRHLLKGAGLEPGMYKTLFARNPPNAAVATYAGEASAAGAGDIVLDLGVVKKAIDTKLMKILAKSEQFEHIPWAVKGDMDPQLKTQIQQLLAQLKDSKRGRGILKRARLTQLIPTVDSEYDPHRQIVAEVLGESY